MLAFCRLLLTYLQDNCHVACCHLLHANMLQLRFLVSDHCCLLSLLSASLLLCWSSCLNLCSACSSLCRCMRGHSQRHSFRSASCESYTTQTLRSVGYHASSCAPVAIWLKHPCAVAASSAAHSAAMATLDVLCAGSQTMLCRPCVDCGLYTGRFCDGCLASRRVPSERWANNQHTPLCSRCDWRWGSCRFCRGVHSCTPFATGQKPTDDEQCVAVST